MGGQLRCVDGIQYVLYGVGVRVCSVILCSSRGMAASAAPTAYERRALGMSNLDAGLTYCRLIISRDAR